MSEATDKSPDQGSVVPVNIQTIADSSRDPIKVMIEICTHDGISDEDKTQLITYALNRFNNRRKMAYIALYSLIASLALLFLASFIDGISGCGKDETCYGILDAIAKNQELIIWIDGFLAAIVAAYYGVTAWRPAS